MDTIRNSQARAESARASRLWSSGRKEDRSKDFKSPGVHIKKKTTHRQHLLMIAYVGQLTHWPTQQLLWLKAPLSQTLFIIITILFVLIHESHQFLLMPTISSSSVSLLSDSVETMNSPLGFASARLLYPRAGTDTVLRQQFRVSDDKSNSDHDDTFSYEPGRPPPLPTTTTKMTHKPVEKLPLIQSQLADLRRQLEAELSSADHPKATLGSPCFAANDCYISIANSHCRFDNFTCSCLPQHVEYNSTTCLSPSLLGYECLIDAQCKQKVANSFCSAGKCSCLDNHVAYRKDKCLAASKIDDYCLNDRQCQLGDKHSHCKWKIPHVYGLCKCPPNYKPITVLHQTSGVRQGGLLATNNTSVSRSRLSVTSTRCAPRLGDSCFDDQDCLLATRNSFCREPLDSDTLFTGWRSSDASPRKCFCAKGFIESANKLDCQPIVQPTSTNIKISIDTNTPRPLISFAGAVDRQHPTNTTNAQPIFLISATNSMSAKHHYELVIVNQTGKEEITGTKMPIKETSDTMQLVALSALKSFTINSTRTTKRPNTNMNTNMNTNTDDDIGKRNTAHTYQVDEFKLSSLGKPCLSKGECQARDANSDCRNGICECIMPTSKCNATSTGCHKGTFQCRNGQCISWYFVCDLFKNCDDGSDEDECQTNACPPEAFQCDNGRCIARGKICNGKRDCTDGSDEKHCHSNYSNNSSPNSNSNSNSNSNFKLNLTTIDGISEPSAEATASLDSEASPRTCHPRAFTCDDGQCLPAHVFCNAVQDCADGSDENEQLCERVWRKWAPLQMAPILVVNNMSYELTSETLPIALGTLVTPIPYAPQTPGRPAEDSPFRKADRSSINMMLASLNLSARTPEYRGRQRLVPPLQRHLKGDQQRRQTANYPATSFYRRESRRSRTSQDHSRSRDSGRYRNRDKILIRSQLDECPKSAFTCRNGKCRSSAILCSGIDGCGDSSDEDQCEVCQCEAPKAG